MGWGKQAVLKAICDLHDQGQDISFTAQLGSPVWAASQRYFGSYRKAVESAGIDYRRVWRRRLTKWDREKITADLRKLARAGENLSSRSLRRTHSSLYASAIHWFGTYRQAVESARLDYSKVSRRSDNYWSRDAIRLELRRLRKKGQPMHPAAIERDHPSLVVAAYRYFGNYRRAIEAAGFKYDDIRTRPHRTWSRGRVTRELKRLQRSRHGLWERSVRRQQPYLPRAARQLFGSYPAAVKAAGIHPSALQPPEYRFWSPERVIEQLKALYMKDIPLYAPRLRDRKPYLYRACVRRFGTYRAALAAAGIDFPMRPLRHWTESLVLRTLRELHRDGTDLRFARIKKKRLPLFEAARYYFGNYTNAIRCAGLDYDQIVKLHLQR